MGPEGAVGIGAWIPVQESEGEGEECGQEVHERFGSSLSPSHLPIPVWFCSGTCRWLCPATNREMELDFKLIKTALCVLIFLSGFN